MAYGKKRSTKRAASSRARPAGRRVGRSSRRGSVSKPRASGATTVRVVIQQAPAPVASAGAVSMQSLRSARF